MDDLRAMPAAPPLNRQGGAPRWRGRDGRTTIPAMRKRLHHSAKGGEAGPYAAAMPLPCR
jgi:hypothetical protein